MRHTRPVDGSVDKRGRRSSFSFDESRGAKRSAGLGVLAVLVSGLATSTLEAQIQRRFALDLSAGRSVGTGGGDAYFTERMLSAEALVSARFRKEPGHSPVVSIGVGMAGREGDHVAICDPLPDGGCVAPFPRTRIRFAMAGWEWLNQTESRCACSPDPGGTQRRTQRLTAELDGKRAPTPASLSQGHSALSPPCDGGRTPTAPER